MSNGMFFFIYYLRSRTFYHFVVCHYYKLIFILLQTPQKMKRKVDMIAKLPQTVKTSVSNVKHPTKRHGSHRITDGFVSAICIILWKQILNNKPKKNINTMPPNLPKFTYPSPKGEIFELLAPLCTMRVNRWILANPPVMGLLFQMNLGING